MHKTSKHQIVIRTPHQLLHVSEGAKGRAADPTADVMRGFRESTTTSVIQYEAMCLSSWSASE